MNLNYIQKKKWILSLNNWNIKIASIFLLIFILIYFFIIETNKTNDFDDLYKKIYSFECSISKSFWFTFIVENEISSIKKYWKINKSDKLIENNYLINNLKNETPEISVIITNYNQGHCIYKSLRSVQNQLLKNIEIIIVDDYSSDDSIKVIEKYQKDDNRIILLKHDNNYGKIKSRSDAIKIAKGKYITIIDGDDGLATRNILYNSLNIAKIADLDVVEFRLAYFVNSFFKRIENNLEPIDNLNCRIIYQPELKYKFIKIRNKENQWSYLNRNICSKLVRNILFKKVLDYIGPSYTEEYISIFEDTIMSISLFFLSNSYYLMKESGYYRTKGECEEKSTKEKGNKCKSDMNKINVKSDSMKYIYFLSEKLNNTKIETDFIYNEIFTIDYNLNLGLYLQENPFYIFNLLKLIINKFTFLDNNQKCKINYLIKRISTNLKVNINL